MTVWYWLYIVTIQIQILYCINNLQSQEDGAIMTE